MTVATSTYLNVEDEFELLLRRPADERAARATLRGQIARLDHELAMLTFDLWNAGRTRPPSSDSERPRQVAGRLLALGELEDVRDGLLERIHRTRNTLRERTEAETAA